MDEILSFLGKNWLNLCLVIVGASAFLTYWLQLRKKVSEAASLIIMQVEDLQNNINEMKTYIVQGQLNETAFYESEILIKTNYWDKYKHYFIHKIDPFSFSTFDKFYICASEILEQQELMKTLQRNHFLLSQQMIMQTEAHMVLQILTQISEFPKNYKDLFEELIRTSCQNVSDDQKNDLKKFFEKIFKSNYNIDYNNFWSIYSKNRQFFRNIFDQGAFTTYIPVQIRASLEKALNQFNAISVIGCGGYHKLKKLSKRKI